MAEQVILWRVTDANGSPVSGAKLRFYEAGTDTLLTVYTDEALSVAHPSPVLADAGGVPPQVFYGGSPAIRMRIFAPDETGILDLDPAPTSSTSSGAAQITFAPITGNAATDVQDAIANNTAAILAAQEADTNARRIVTTGGSGNAYTLTAADSITAYANGQTFLMLADRANTGAATLNVDGVGPAPLRKRDTSLTVVELAAGDIAAGNVYRVQHDGTRFVLVSPALASETIPGVVEKATSAEVAAGTADKYADAAELRTALDAATTLIAAGVLNGTGTPAWTFRAGFGASVTDNGTGDYTVAFDAAEANANYVVQITLTSPGTGTANRAFAFPYSPTVNGFSIRATDINGTAADYSAIHVAVHRMAWV